MTERRKTKRKNDPNETSVTRITDIPDKQIEEMSTIALFIRLGRPKFLYYSFMCQMIGVLYAMKIQNVEFDLYTLIALQLTIWFMHLSTHYFNEYADVECDKLNTNAGAWTGGSKVLARGLLPPWISLLTGMVLLLVTFLCGAWTSLRYAQIRHLPSESLLSLLVDGVYRDPAKVWPYVPWDMVLIGVSVMFVAVAYSMPQLGRLSSLGLGELCVGYVLAYSAPAVGAASQNGKPFDWEFVAFLIPFIAVGFSRMIVMNIPDRDGDLKGGKYTSVVRLGERGGQYLSSICYLVTYGILVPVCVPTWWLRCGYWAVLPLRMWQSARIHRSMQSSHVDWWKDKHLTDSIPFVESLTVLVTALCLNVFLAFA